MRSAVRGRSAASRPRQSIMPMVVMPARPVGVALMPSTARAEDAVGSIAMWLGQIDVFISRTLQSRSAMVSRLPLIQMGPSGSPASSVA